MLEIPPRLSPSRPPNQMMVIVWGSILWWNGKEWRVPFDPWHLFNPLPNFRTFNMDFFSPKTRNLTNN